MVWVNDIPFISFGADHACEHLNRSTEIHSGLIGISTSANARQRFFVVTPELSRLAKAFKSQFDLEHNKPRDNHALGPCAVKKEHDTIDKIKVGILKHGSPFAVEAERLHNVIMHAYIPDKYVTNILIAVVTGQKLYEDYVTERIMEMSAYGHL